MGREARVNGGCAWVPEELVYVGYPVGSSELPCFTGSMRRLIRYEAVKHEPLLGGVFCEPGLYVDDNRNRMVEHLLKAPPFVKWLLQIDTDIEFKPDILERMLALAKANEFKILAASVPIGETFETCAYLFGDTPGRLHVVTKLPPEPVRVDAIATACTLIHRDVFQTMAEKLGPCWFDRISVADPDSDQGGPMEFRKNLVLGEDISFCCRAKVLGVPIWCAHVPGLRHWKLVGFTHDAASEWPQRQKGPVTVAHDDSSGGMGEIVQEGVA